MNYLEVKKDIYWVGSLDPELRVFDIIMYTPYGTTYNSYVVKGSEKIAVFETVKEKCFDDYLSKLNSLGIDPKSIDYIIVDHTEPDHAGSVEKLLELSPKAKVIGSMQAIEFLKDIVNKDFEYIVVGDNDTISLGNKTLQFISAPFLHWPDSMYTYIPEDKALISFGSHYSCEEVFNDLVPNEEEYLDALRYYYDCIFGPYKPYVLKAIDKIKYLDIELVCPGHGPILRQDPWKIINTYKEWSTPVKPKINGDKKVTIPYVSAYGYTGELAEAIVKGIQEVDTSIDVVMYNLDILNYPQKKDEILAAFADADGILFGTCTINGDALPIIWDLAINLNPIVHGGKVVSCFGSYGWSGEGVDNIMDRLHQLRMKVLDGFKIKFRASDRETKDAIDYGKLFAKCLIEGKVPARKKAGATNTEDLNPSGKVVLWRCVICGEVYPGVLPPEVCPACGVGADLFEQYEEEVITFNSTKEENFVIVGSGVAAVSAANAIRARNEVASITLISKEASYPYYRPALSDLIVKDVPTEEFYLNPEAYYAEKNITLKLSTTVESLDATNKSLVLSDGITMSYDKLILATGSSNFIPPIKGANAEGVFSIKDKEDALALREYAKGKSKAVIIGGGVLGLEAADALQELGLQITVIEAAPRIMPRQLEESASAFMQNILATKNINLITEASAQEIVANSNKVTGVKVNNELIEADLVVISVGVRANTGLAVSANITVDRGIVVNENMQTSVADIYACGDVAQFEGISTNLWAPAIEQGKVAGTNAVGDVATFANQVEPLSLIAFDTEMFSVGTYPTENMESYQVMMDSNPATGLFKKLYFKDNHLVYGVLFKDISKANVVLNGVRQGHDYQTVMSKMFN